MSNKEKDGRKHNSQPFRSHAGGLFAVDKKDLVEFYLFLVHGANHLIRLNKEGQMAQGEWCITPHSNIIRTGHCTKGTVNGAFKYDHKIEQIINSNANTCLTAAENSGS
uniref:Ricin B lectin domain-containing protein n=1 Tax=Panagrolaimus davidi TaxID=227884 RepID=A0A914QVQ9_9BILA